MSYEMSVLRKEDLSLYLYIKDTVLNNFVEHETNVPLALMPELCDMDSYVYEYNSDLEPSPTERGRGWRYFNTPSGGLPCEPYPTVPGLNGDGDPTYGTPEQSYVAASGTRSADGIRVWETTVTSGISDLTVVSDLVYMVDYIDGRIISTRKLGSPAYVDFSWNYVSVVDEWAAVEAADPPVIVIDMHGTDKAGYQLGGGKKSTRKVDIHVFATDPAERNDIVETLYDGLYIRSCSLYGFPTGSVLDYDGTFYGRVTESGTLKTNKLTYLFDRSPIIDEDGAVRISRLYFDSVTSRHVNLPLIMTRGRDEVMLSDLNAYRSKVSFDMFSYDDRTTTRTY
jgi:hypothetical protein